MNYPAIAEMLHQHVLGAVNDTERVVATAITGNLIGFFQEGDPSFDVNEFRRLTGLSNPSRKES